MSKSCFPCPCTPSYCSSCIHYLKSLYISMYALNFKTEQFYYATIAYHVGLNALLVAVRNYDHLFLAVASGCRHVICPFVSTFLVGRRHFTVFGKYLLPFSSYISVQFYCYTSLFMYFIYHCIKHILANFHHFAFVICPYLEFCELASTGFLLWVF